MSNLTRRAILRGTPAAIAAAATITLPAIAASAAVGDDAVLLGLEAQWLAAERAADEADRGHQAIVASLPEEAFGAPSFPEADPLFVGVRKDTVRSADGFTGRSVITLEAICQFNLTTEFCVSEWRDMEASPHREELRQRWLRRRAEGRQRVSWWKAKKRERQAILDASGELDARQESDRHGGVVCDVEGEIMDTPASTIVGVAIKLRVAASMITLNGKKAVDDLEWAEQITLAAVRDAERLAGMSSAGGTA